ncbi:DUF1206 domain-containing protein [Yinghuangia seranimata]|uniref:DUF1206 domain-containing protein n=1 Tax=Yinghuangia seranimata TaxID=408067 RepID=UPI00248C4CE5|nr:DUF1206 domain-containing protein [Yinghuangia seranimata]MDI2125399.1 DUF1206 domain-containing protein [Yinghuangia seranimata]
MRTTTARSRRRATRPTGAGDSAIATAARAGLAARGAVYLLVGVLALRIAFGDTGRQADRGGAVRELAKQPFGGALVWALGVGLACMALWRLSEAVFGAAGRGGRKAGKRLLSLARFAFYAVAAGSVLSLAAGRSDGQGGSGEKSSDQQSKDATAKALDMPGGRWLVAAAGLVVVGVGIGLAVRALRRTYRDHLKLGEMSAGTRRTVDALGIAGGTSRGTVYAAAGLFVLVAAAKYDPDKAKGLDDTLRSFADTPAGPPLLAAVAVGLMLFGLLSFAMVRWRRV